MKYLLGSILFSLILIHDRQLDESTVRSAEMNGFILHLQNEVKEAVIKEEPDLHVYSIKDVDM